MAIQYLNGINVSGSVGIGTDSPEVNRVLDVNGNMAVRSNIYVAPAIGETSNSAYSIEIGQGRTGNGYAFLDFVGDDTYSDHGLRIIRGNTGANTFSEIKHRGTGLFKFYAQEAANITFLTSNSERMRIASNGNVGIGTSSPSKKLHISDSGNPKILIEDTSGDNQAAVIYKTTNYEWTAGLHGGEDAFKISNSDAFNTNDYFTIKNSGNVGIGTTSPVARLDLGSSNTISTGLGFGSTSSELRRGNSGNNVQLSHWGNLSMIIDSDNNDTTRYFNVMHGANDSSSATELFRVQENGNVGIGTTTPGAKLDIAVTPSAPWMNLINGDESAFRLTTYNNGTNNGSSAYAFKHGLYYTTTENAAITFYRGGSTTGGFLTFTTNNGSERMRIDSSGNVGIGTTSPAVNFQVGSGTTDTESRFYFSDGSYTSVRGYGLYMSRNFSYIRPTADESQTLNIGALNSAWGTISHNSLLHTFGKDSSEFMRINSSGNVGIGTTSPQYQLHSYSEIGTQTLRLGYGVGYARITTDDASKPLDLQIGGSTKLSVNQNGNVGIGTTSQVGKLSVYRTDTTYAVNLSDARSRSSLYLKGSGNFDSELTFSSGSSNVQFIQAVNSSATTGRDIAINPFGGDVGIGTTSPGYNLDVTGTARITNNMWLGSNIYHDNDGNSAYIGFPTDDTWRVVTSGSERLRVNSSGNVGIGTTSPQYPLDVNGTVDATSFRAGGVSKYTIHSPTNSYENYGTTISNIASSPVGYLYHDLLAFNYNYTVTQEVSTDGTNFSSETLDKRLFSQKQDQALTVVGSSEYAVRWTIEGTNYNTAKYVNIAFTYNAAHPETRVIIESSGDGTTWTSRHDSTAPGITGTKSCYVNSWGSHNYVRITISKTSTNTGVIKLSSVKMMTARAGDQGDGQELQYPYVWDENRNIGLMPTKTNVPTSKLDILGATNTSSSSLLKLRSTTATNAPEKVAAFYYNANTERGYIAVNQYAVTYSTSSDYRLKENVVPISNGIERVKELNPCRFNFIGANTNNVVDGFLAHEAADVVPESVTGEKDAVNENNEPIYQGIDQSKIVPLLTAALKEAIEKIEQLENRIQTLENN